LKLKVRDRVFDLLGITLLSFAVFWLWVLVVDPLPERDSYAGFYYPFLNYLRASLEFPNDFWFLTDQVVLNEYPRGGFGLAWLISVLGLQSIFLKQPYLIAIFLIFPLCLIPFFFQLDRSGRWVFGILIFFFPPTQVLLKSFSVHGFNVVYALLGFLFFRSYLARGKWGYLAGFAVAFWFAMVTKHLGVLLYVNLLLAYFFYSIFNRRFDPAAIITMILVSLAALPFYYLESFLQYVEGVMHHNPSLSVAEFVLLGATLVLLCVVVASLMARWNRGVVLPRSFSSPLALLLFCSIPLVLVSVETESQHANLHILAVLILGYGGLFGCLFHYRFSSTRSFLYLFVGLTYVNGSLLYVSLVGKTSYVFFLPLLLILIQTLLELRSSKLRVSILVLCFLLSNLTPSSKNLQTWLGGVGLNFCLNGLNGIHYNPLGWQKGEIHQIHEELIEVLKSKEYPVTDSLLLFDNLHFYSRLLLTFPPNFFLPFPSLPRLDNLPLQKLEEISKQYKNSGEELFESWIRKSKFPILIVGLQPWDIQLGVPSSLEILMDHDSLTGEFGPSISRAFFKFLETSSKLGDLYEPFPIPKGNPRIMLYVLRSLPTAHEETRGFNASLSEISWHLPVDFLRESRPPWFEKIQKQTQERIRQREASQLHETAVNFLDQGNYLESYIVLRKAYALAPQHTNIKIDLQQVQGRIPPSLWIFLNQKGLEPLERF